MKSRRPRRPARATTLLFFALLWAFLPTGLAADAAPITRLSHEPSLNLRSLDTATEPCEDFYQYACGGWIENNPIPADQSRISTYGKLYVENQRHLWGILEELARGDAERSPEQALLGDYFGACMDTDGIEKAGLRPLRAELDLIESISSKADLGAALGRLIRNTDSKAFFVALGSQQDAQQSERMIGAVYAGGLGLPDRDYYLTDEPLKADNRAHYREHVAVMLQLLGESAAQARRSAATVLRIETALAAASLTRVQRRDPHAVYNRRSLAELAALAPVVDWRALFDAAGLRPEPWLNVVQPSFIREIQAVIERESLAALRSYLRWGLVNTRAELLSKAFRDAHFAFYSAYLEGIAEPPPRWRTCVSQVDRQLGEALGREFVARNFPPQVREQVRDMSRLIRRAMAERIGRLGWMSAETQQQALLKLGKMREKIGYPDSWRDYSSLQLRADDYFGNVTCATGFDLQRQLERIGKPLDRGQWFMSPATVNAYYNPSMNDINFPAGVLMPPLFDPRTDAAPNYGNTGATIGHELVHGFDDEGRHYDGDGNLRDWWTPADATAFEAGAQCLREQYTGYRVIDDIYINAELTAGEDIADLGGLVLAWHAWREATRNEELQPIDGLSPEQRFFIGFAQWACAAERPESLRLHAATDPHSPPRFRINGVLVNMPEFGRAFGCSADSPMVKPAAEICRIW
ncbi:MAG: M13 family metallopeptidase [Xanthomonadales bacterium]|nr:M13 family metallopeptidase [Xanthomonadales bacterium]